MRKILNRLPGVLCLSLLGILCFAKPVNLQGAPLSTAKDTMDVSRASWVTTLSSTAPAGSTTFYLTDAGTIIINSILPGDVIKFWNGTTESLVVATVNTTNKFVTTTSASANQHISAGTGTVSGGWGTEATPDVGGTTATHTIYFVPSTSVYQGEVRITFPANATTPTDGKPDTDGFDFNTLVSGTSPGANFGCTGGGTAGWGGAKSATMSGSYGLFVFPFTKTLSTTAVTCTLGSAARATGIHLINPAKTAATGTSDNWTVNVQTMQFPNYTEVDATDVMIATIESVRVTATVNPTLSVIVSGTANGTSVCGETTNAGASNASTAVLVPLGTLSSTALNVNAQNVSVATNGHTGYVTYIQDDGKLRNSAGDDINYYNPLTANDDPVNTVLNTTGTEAYGVHSCGTHVNTTTWGTDGAATALYGAPGSGTAFQFYRTLASYTAPVAATITKVLYKATISGITPSGDYGQNINYVVTGTF